MPLDPERPSEVRVARLEGSYEQIDKRLSNLERSFTELQSEIRDSRSELGYENGAPKASLEKLRRDGDLIFYLAVLLWSVALILQVLDTFGISLLTP